MYINFLKNILDFIFAFLLLIFLLPLMVSIYLILFIQIGSPIFTQKRPGYNNKTFILYKFKTIIDKHCRGFKKKKNFFRFGFFLRNTGLDELPQLINVLKGEISLVGPRPLRIKYLKINKFRRHVRKKCKPGITGLAQVESFKINKNQIIKKNEKWKKNFELDKYYYFHLSFFLDMKILFLTFFKFIKFSKKQDFIKEPRLLEKYINIK